MKKIIVSLILIVVSFTTVKAQQTPIKEYKHSVGFAASFTSGYGLSYRHHFTDMFSIQGTGFVYYFKEDSEVNSGYNIGFELQQGLLRINNERFFIYLGYSYHHHFDKYNWVYIEFNDDFDKEKKISHNVGIGIGYDFIFNQHFSFGVTGGFRYLNSTTEHYENNNYKINSSERIGLLLSIGVNIYLLI